MFGLGAEIHFLKEEETTAMSDDMPVSKQQPTPVTTGDVKLEQSVQIEPAGSQLLDVGEVEHSVSLLPIRGTRKIRVHSV